MGSVQNMEGDMCSNNADKSDKTNIEECTYEELIGINKIRAENKTQDKSCDCVDYEVLKNAFNFANSCRDKEIDRFWSRGLYFWGFIVAYFTAYFVTLSNIIPRESEDYVDLTFEQFLLIPFMGKLILFVISFVIFIFCLSWLLVHKGSKYWQENWEEHIYQLEKNYMGHILILRKTIFLAVLAVLKAMIILSVKFLCCVLCYWLYSVFVYGFFMVY